MRAKGWFSIGLMGGLIAFLCLFLPWITASAYGMSESASGWDILTEEKDLEGVAPPLLALGGSVLVILGAFGGAVDGRAIGALLPIGGLAVITGSVWGFYKVYETAASYMWGFSSLVNISPGFGLFLCFIGGVISLVGSYGLKK